MPLSPAALEPLLRLALVPGIGPARLTGLIRHFGSADRVLGASSAEIREIPRVGRELARRLGEAGRPAAAERARVATARLERAGAVALTPDDLAYPEGFHILPDPPFLLFAMGRLELLAAAGVAVVGTREPTPYGRAAAAQLAEGLVRGGYAVVSGMAKGIDAVAHLAALDAGGATVGVLGHGIDRIYPPQNRPLFERVRAEGVLCSELPPGEEPRAQNFPRRNRLIAALSNGVLVVEMAARSGAQHTVNYALEQGKEVFAVPGPIGSSVSEGTNQLLKDGARLVTGVEDVLEELGGVRYPPAARGAAQTAVRPAPAAPSAEPPDLPPNERCVLLELGADPVHVDDVSTRSGLAPSLVLAAMLGLELRGLVEALPGKHFRRT
ncbi:DNA-processing protein DprA [soil metagenome]